MGTDDIVTIVRDYTSRSFGFASRNFYVSFLAALDIDHNPEKYFGPLQKEPEAHFREVELPAYVSISGRSPRTVKIDGESCASSTRHSCRRCGTAAARAQGLPPAPAAGG